MQTRLRIQAVTAAMAALALAACGGPSDDTVPGDELTAVEGAQAREAADEIDPNGLGDAPADPNGLGQPASGANENGLGTPAAVTTGERVAGQNQDGRGNAEAGGDGAPAGGIDAQDDDGVATPDEPAGPGCAPPCKIVAECTNLTVGACVSNCEAQADADPEATAEGIACVLDADGCDAVVACLQ